MNIVKFIEIVVGLATFDPKSESARPYHVHSVPSYAWIQRVKECITHETLMLIHQEYASTPKGKEYLEGMERERKAQQRECGSVPALDWRTDPLYLSTKMAYHTESLIEAMHKILQPTS